MKELSKLPHFGSLIEISRDGEYNKKKYFYDF
jgi:hypothetical protein